MSSYYRKLAELLKQHGWSFDRHGKGRHEIWVNPATGRKIVVPYDCNVRNTANGILKDAGIGVKL